MIFQSIYRSIKTSPKIIAEFCSIKPILLASALLMLIACENAQRLIQAEFDTFLQPPTVLLYEHAEQFSSATGSCAGTKIDRWYGSEILFTDLTEIYEGQLQSRGWELWPEDVGRIWRKQNSKGLFSLSMQALDLKKGKKNPQGLYTLPDTFWASIENHSTIYVISLRYMDTAHTKRCFGK